MISLILSPILDKFIGTDSRIEIARGCKEEGVIV